MGQEWGYLQLLTANSSRGVKRLTFLIYERFCKDHFTTSCTDCQICTLMAIASFVFILLIAMEAEKSVLVTFWGRNRIVTFYTGLQSDESSVTAAVRTNFRDVIKDEQFFLQMKNEDWGGAFVELLEDQTIPDKAVIEAVAVQKRTEVFYPFYFVI